MSRPMVNIDHYRRAAKRRLPQVAFDIIDGAANDEITMRANRDDFDRLVLSPRAYADVRTRDLSAEYFGVKVSLPVLLGPCGSARMAHRQAELAVARAAGAMDTIFAVSTVTSYSLEAIAEAASGPLWFQLYPPADPDEVVALVRRAKAAGYRAMVVTVDGAVIGTRDRDRHHNLQMPFKWSPNLVWQGIRRPRWSADFVRSGAAAMRTAPVTHSPKSISASVAAIQATAIPVTLDTLKLIRDHWEGPLLIKGVLRPEDVEPLHALGAQGVIVSNHGGRQLDTVSSSIAALPDVVAAAGDGIDVFMDGGVRRGTDIIKALALGAKGVLVGRPYLYGLAARGQAGVEDVLGLIRDELDTAMALAGCATIADIRPDVLARRDAHRFEKLPTVVGSGVGRSTHSPDVAVAVRR